MAAGDELVVWALGYSVDFQVQWLPLLRVTAGSSIERCSSGTMLRSVVASIWIVSYMFQHAQLTDHVRLGARDRELHGVLSGIGRHAWTMRPPRLATSVAALSRAMSGLQARLFFPTMLFSSISGNLLSTKTIFLFIWLGKFAPYRQPFPLLLMSCRG